MWFTNCHNNSIGRISTAGVVTNYTGTGIDEPEGITAGPDGALWFTNSANNSIGRISTDGVVTNYPGTGIDDPGGITAGPDGALWFTNFHRQLDRADQHAGVVTHYTGTGIDGPVGITAGPDGALWFTNGGNNSIGRISTAGVVTNYTDAGIDEAERDHGGSRRRLVVHQHRRQLDRADQYCGFGEHLGDTWAVRNRNDSYGSRIHERREGHRQLPDRAVLANQDLPVHGHRHL